MNDAISTIRAALLAELADLSRRIAALNAEAPDQRIEGIDLVPGNIDPPRIGDGIVPGSLDLTNGSVVLDGWMRAVTESAGSDDKWHRAWAGQKNRADCYILPIGSYPPELLAQLSAETRELMTEATRRASTMWALIGTDPRDGRFDRMARSFPAYPLIDGPDGFRIRGPNAIPGVHAFVDSRNPDELAHPQYGYQIALSDRRKWIEAQPQYVSERTGIVYGQTKR